VGFPKKRERGTGHMKGRKGRKEVEADWMLSTRKFLWGRRIPIARSEKAYNTLTGNSPLTRRRPLVPPRHSVTP